MLAWLDSDREVAGQKYEQIRQKLIKMFIGRGCPDPEELASETLSRVTRKIQDIADTYEGDPMFYCYKVAYLVYLESIRKRPQPLPMPPPDSSEQVEREYDCLERCMSRLQPGDRELVLQYYQQDKRAKIDHRKELADKMGIALNALRIRAHRIRLNLRRCMLECLEEER